jgi:hypothetical protein
MAAACSAGLAMAEYVRAVEDKARCFQNYAYFIRHYLS